MSTRPAIVAHAGARDQYQLALALYEHGLLEHLVTDLYAAPRLISGLERAGLGSLAALLRRRSCAGLLQPRLSLTPVSLMLAALSDRVRNPAVLLSRSDRRLGLAALARAKRTGANLYLYSYYAAEAFRQAPPGMQKVLFQLHPHPIELRRLFEEEAALNPAAARSLCSEKEMSLTPEELSPLASEPALADHVVVASSFTRRTLVDQGISSDKISVIPYGVDCSAFPARTAPPPREAPFTIVFVGSFVQRKGISYLLDAVNSFSASRVKLVVATRRVHEEALPPGAKSDNVEYRLGLSSRELVALLHSSHMFALPSLAEGFGLAITEAMAAGVPALASVNSCGADIIEHGENGFVVPIRDAAAIRSAIEIGLADRDRLFTMGQEAAHTARCLTWGRFRQAVAEDYLRFTADPACRVDP